MITTTAARPSSRTSRVSKTLTRSPWIPAGPSTLTVSPSAVGAIARITSTSPPSAKPSSESSGTMTCRALPSSDGMTGGTSPTIDRSGELMNACRSVFAVARSAGVIPLSRT